MHVRLRCHLALRTLTSLSLTDWTFDQKHNLLILFLSKRNELLDGLLALDTDAQPLIQLLSTARFPIELSCTHIPFQDCPIDPARPDRLCMTSQVRKQGAADAP